MAALALILLALIVASPCFATASENFYERDGEIFDDWNICRTRAVGPSGFLRISPSGFDPVIARESLGDNVHTAWELGLEFVQAYPDVSQRAEQIFFFVRNRVDYTSDPDRFGLPEFAVNADEIAQDISDHALARGDCEDSAVLLAVMYKAAGYRSALVLAPSHIAALVYLPEYRNAARVLQVAGEEGWVWAEATGRTNPLGWLPEEFLGEDLLVRELTIEDIDAGEPSGAEATTVTRSAGFGSSAYLLSFGAIALLWLMSRARRRPQRKKARR